MQGRGNDKAMPYMARILNSVNHYMPLKTKVLYPKNLRQVKRLPNSAWLRKGQEYQYIKYVPKITQDPKRSTKITKDHQRSHKITQDHSILPKINQDHS